MARKLTKEEQARAKADFDAPKDLATLQNSQNKKNSQNKPAAKAPKDPTREGYTFKGWDIAFDDVTKDLIVTAQWEPVKEAPAETPKQDVPKQTTPATKTLAAKTTQSPLKGDAPKTGDTNHMVLWAVLAGVSAASALVAFKRKRA